MTQPVLFYGLAIIAAFTVGLSKGGVPMVGVLGVPVLALVISPVAAAALLLPIYIVSDWFGLWAYRKSYDKRNLVILIPAAALGIGVGWAIVAFTSEQPVMTFDLASQGCLPMTRDRLVKILISMVGISYFINALIKRGNVPMKASDVPRGLFWGTLTGFTSFISHSGAPPYQMYTLPQKLPKMVFAGTSTILFAIVNALKLVPYWSLGQFNPGNLRTAALLSPVAMLGAYAGYRTTRIIPEKLFFQIVETALGVVSLKLLVDALWPVAC